MQNVQRLSQAYTQAPWRKQMQFIGLFSLGLIIVALVAGIYLNVTARTATIGRSIQSMRVDIDVAKLDIEDLRSQLAYISSNSEMQKRAEDLGYVPVESDDLLYIQVPGYVSRQSVVVAPPLTDPLPTTQQEPEIYSQSLFSWLRERVFDPAGPLGAATP